MDYVISGINWDTDGQEPSELDLPTEIEINLSDEGLETVSDVGDWLSDKYGWAVSEYSYDLKNDLKP